MTQGVKADTGQAGALGSRDEHAPAQTALIGRGTGAARKHERVVFGAASSLGSQYCGQIRGQRDEPRAVARLGGHRCAFDDRAAHLQMRRPSIEPAIGALVPPLLTRADFGTLRDSLRPQQACLVAPSSRSLRHTSEHSRLKAGVSA